MGQAQNAVRKHKRAYQITKNLHKNHKRFGKFRKEKRHEIPTVLDRAQTRRGKTIIRKTEETVREEAREVRNEKSEGKVGRRKVQRNRRVPQEK